MSIRSRKYRIVPTIVGNRAEAWKLQHKLFFFWIDTRFGFFEEKVIWFKHDELVSLIKHLKTGVLKL